MYIYGIMHPYAHCLLGLWGPMGLGLDLGGNAGRDMERIRGQSKAIFDTADRYL